MPSADSAEDRFLLNFIAKACMLWYIIPGSAWRDPRGGAFSFAD